MEDNDRLRQQPVCGDAIQDIIDKRVEELIQKETSEVEERPDSKEGKKCPRRLRLKKLLKRSSRR